MRIIQNFMIHKHQANDDSSGSDSSGKKLMVIGNLTKVNE